MRGVCVCTVSQLSCMSCIDRTLGWDFFGFEHKIGLFFFLILGTCRCKFKCCVSWFYYFFYDILITRPFAVLLLLLQSFQQPERTQIPPSRWPGSGCDVPCVGRSQPNWWMASEQEPWFVTMIHYYWVLQVHFERHTVLVAWCCRVCSNLWREPTLQQVQSLALKINVGKLIHFTSWG